MIYSAPTEANLCLECRAIDSARMHLVNQCLRSHPPTILMTKTPTASTNLSLVFGPSIVRKKYLCSHLCTQAFPISYGVNRLWYGRALVSLRTHAQASMRATAS